MANNAGNGASGKGASNGKGGGNNRRSQYGNKGNHQRQGSQGGAKKHSAPRGPKTKEMAGTDEAAIKREQMVKKRELCREYVEQGSEEQKKMLMDLRQEILRYDADAVDLIAEGINWKASGENETTLDAMNRLYSKALLEQCVRPIIQGRGTEEAVWQAAGVMLAGYITNKEFRSTINKGALNIISPYVEKKSAVAGPNSRWRKWEEQIARSQNDGRLPLTPKSAAMMQLGVDRKFYRELREPNANKGELYESYIKCCKDLRTMAERDGIDEAELTKNVRTLVGQMKDIDPAVARMYNETAFDAVRKGPGQFDNVSGKKLWAGEFVDRKDNAYTGGFSVRMPTGPKQWAQTLDASMEDAFKRCKTADDVFDLGRVISGEKAPDGKSWMDGWQRRNERDFAVMHDDCATPDDFNKLDGFIEQFAAKHMDAWMDRNPKEAEEIRRRWASQQAQGEGPVYDADDYSSYGQANAVANAGQKAERYANGEEIPQNRRVELPYHEDEGDNPDFSVSYGG